MKERMVVFVLLEWWGMFSGMFHEVNRTAGGEETKGERGCAQQRGLEAWE